MLDTAGTKEYNRLRLIAYPGTNVILICFSLVNRQSLEIVVSRCMPECRHIFSLASPTTKFVLVATKKDLRNDAQTLGRLHAMGQTPVSTEEGIAMAKSIGCDAYVETSALTGEGIQSVFRSAMHLELVMNPAPHGGSSPRGDTKCLLQ